MKVDTSFNILASFAYLAKDKNFLNRVMSKAKAQELNLMLDSGAFTAYNSKTDTSYINIDNYCSFLEVYSEFCEKYVMLDVIFNKEQSKQNYETMVARGFAPMYVVTANDNDYSYIEDTFNVNRNICVAGGASEPVSWCIKKYQNVYYKTGNKAKIHGLAFVKYPTFLQLPLASVDSSAWIASAARFGNACFFTNKIETLGWQEVLKKGKKLNIYMQKQMDEIRVTPKIYASKVNHCGIASIEVLLSCIAYIKMQNYAKRCGVDLFLATASLWELECLLWTKENWHNLNYAKFRAYMTKK